MGCVQQGPSTRYKTRINQSLARYETKGIYTHQIVGGDCDIDDGTGGSMLGTWSNVQTGNEDIRYMKIGVWGMEAVK